MEHSERGEYVTELVTLWIVNDSDHIEHARRSAIMGPAELSKELWVTIQRSPNGSAAWHLKQELAPNDYTRTDWRRVANELAPECTETTGHPKGSGHRWQECPTYHEDDL